MPRNVEIKARLADITATEAIVAALADRGPEVLRQDDTFFSSPAGRLKLRVLGAHEGQLIFYRRADEPGPKVADFVLAPVAEPESLCAVLTGALGVTGHVRKQRTVYHVGRTRVHLDRVDGLGDFLELEVVLADGEDEARGFAEAQALMARLGVHGSELVTGAYADLGR